ncbi:MAG: hypothetical protein A2487_02370 [Candidatus Raymondbacteria bacterium RifOxyC12_full_50_8]|uniref:Sulfatase-modifying factor enzyme-like domain-containing protein n=1 Tax=Candidatus Raymondbacteria bacterium RIFOXYD12_FULL_49_13 TaxID=1817890 RepID=A0A1F7FI53_UNCRA|nr:MAG: hypothetical protein A2248_20915 [Candidatus Raymondbacteria bacterium RIFOXYA2_FULL_49_16]OGJ99522.1 MAG: hypothetical protein A2350_05480 [Candidatus Raymondbacteria bacterium RifOxyB12_full_50_8]OGK06251.1 MAG: hypothetical protein A2519_08230 [Candidatus Raymondbacteria bacterium RIFOXYD12_FULL_49_13]OGK07708.1 MAG: hypothetical protein A2487_02370 [Candidatus Raymondbacteria bacterium RifOxyC12_full_50_8]OGP40583.1 MAG: hypothetical protein A2324_02985 [Candidatus Raymondbacteria b
MKTNRLGDHMQKFLATAALLGGMLFLCTVSADPIYDTLDLGNGVKLELVLIHAGTFLMGSPTGAYLRKDDECPQHQVTISKNYWMGVYQVTQEQYLEVTGTNPTPVQYQDPTHTVEYMNVARTAAFCTQASIRTGRNVRLPTEAEWEYAARAGTTTPFFFGTTYTNLNLYAWNPSNAGGTTHPVGQLQPNPWGLYDIYGNNFEFCSDFYADAWRYPSEPVIDPTGTDSTEPKKVLRGGAFDMGNTWCSSVARCWGPISTSGRNHGMRVVVDDTGTAMLEKKTGLKSKGPSIHCSPNPFNPQTMIVFDLEQGNKNARALLQIYNAKGSLVVSSSIVPNSYSGMRALYTYAWNASGCLSGVYFARAAAGSRIMSARLLLIK